MGDKMASRIFETDKSTKKLTYFLTENFDEEYGKSGEYLSVIDKISKLKEDDELEIVIDYCSGGYIHQANTLKLAIESIECKKSCRVINSSMSASNIVLSAFSFDELFIRPDASFMFHDMNVYFGNNINNVSEGMRVKKEVSDRLLRDSSVYMTGEQIEKYKSGGDVYMTGEELIDNMLRNQSGDE